jgi:diguanylate cyclase (GGDEF)-like protein
MESLSQSKDSWAKALGPPHLRQAQESLAAFERLKQALDRLEEDPADVALLQEVQLCFRAGAEAGAADGFPAVPEIGMEGDEETRALLSARVDPDRAQVERWRSLLDHLHRELQREPGLVPASGGEHLALPPLHAVGHSLPGEANQHEAASVRVLSMEDDPLQADFIQAVLQEGGYEALSCRDPRRFAADLERFHPDLVLVDIMLPGTSGYELVRSLRRDQRYAGLPVLFLTTQGQMNARVESALAGGDDHLVKPTTPSLLLSAISARLERSRRVELLLQHDELTHLLTRSALLERARAIVERLRGEPRRSALWVMIDLDHFKSIADRHGGAAGDALLVATAALLRRRLGHLGTASHLSRFGGDQFALLFEELGRRESVRRLKSLRQEFAATEHHSPGRVPIRATLSAGVVALTATMDVEKWHETAERALAAAKLAGRNRIEVAR